MWILSPAKTPGFKSVATHLASSQGLCLHEMLPATWAAAPACGKLNHGTSSWDECRWMEDRCHMFCGASHTTATATLTDVPAPSMGCQLNPKGYWIDTIWHPLEGPGRRSSTLKSWTFTVFQGEPLARLLLHPQNPWCFHQVRRMMTCFSAKLTMFGRWCRYMVYMFTPDLWCVFFMTVKHLCFMQITFCCSFECRALLCCRKSNGRTR